MMYLHSRKPPIVHRDVKSDNFLITADWNLKVLQLLLQLLRRLRRLLNAARFATSDLLVCGRLRRTCKRCAGGRGTGSEAGCGVVVTLGCGAGTWTRWHAGVDGA
jgi:hypothetical protein